MEGVGCNASSWLEIWEEGQEIYGPLQYSLIKKLQKDEKHFSEDWNIGKQREISSNCDSSWEIIQ